MTDTDRTVRPPDAADRIRHWRGVALLALVALIWGTTFVVIKGTVAAVQPSTFVLVRFSIAALCLLPFLKRDRWLARAGLELGFLGWAGYAFQAQGLLYTSASRSAFITAVSVVLVPVIAGLIGRRVGASAWLSALLAFVGVALLSYDGAAPNRGDVFTIVTAVTYAIYIVRLESYVVRFSASSLAAAQVVGLLPFALVLTLRDGFDPRFVDTPSAWAAVVYLGVVATALTAWMQTLGQRRVSAPEAAVIYSTEPMWAAFFAAMVFGERFGPRGWLGAAGILAAVVVSELPLRRRRQPHPPAER
jgi:drug/metabolite transporter (DMT)-like permease